MMEPAYIWTEEDFLRNEAETENCVDLLGHLLHDHALVSWVKNNEAARYSADIAAGIQAALISDFEENLRRGAATLRQLAALAEEAREAAANASNKERA